MNNTVEDLHLTDHIVLGCVKPVKYIGNQEGHQDVNPDGCSNYAIWHIAAHEWEELTNKGELEDLCIQYVERTLLLETPSMLQKEEGTVSTPSFRLQTSQVDSDSSLFSDQVLVYNTTGNETSPTDQGTSIDEVFLTGESDHHWEDIMLLVVDYWVQEDCLTIKHLGASKGSVFEELCCIYLNTYDV